MKLQCISSIWHGPAWKALPMAIVALAVVAGLAILGGSDSADAANTTVTVDRDWFVSDVCEVDLPTDGTTDLPAACEINITAGDTVTWGGSGNWNGTHTVTGCPDLAAIQADGSCTPGGSPVGDSGFLADDSTYGPVTFNTAGTYYYKCNLHPQVMLGKIVVAAAPVDSVGPVTSAAAASPDPTNGASSVTLTATVDDSTTGNSNIQAAEYFIDSVGADGAGTAMSASDGTFDGVTENVTASVDVSGLGDGIHTLFVHGQDAGGTGNWGATDSVVFTKSPPPPGSESATITITPGSLSLTTSPVNLGTIELSGLDETVGTSAFPDWSVTDARGDDLAGWNVTLSSTDFTTTGGSITVDNFKMKLLDVNIDTVAGNAPPVSLATSYQPLSGAHLKFLSAALGNGMGTYDFMPDFSLLVPAESVPGSYEAFLTVTLTSGP